MNSGQNYERIDIKWKDGIADIDGTLTHIRKMYKKNIIVEICLEDSEHFRISNWKEAVNILGPEPNVILQTHNEFLNDWDELKRALEKLEYIKAKRFIGGGGAWGNSNDGREIAEKFMLSNPGDTQNIHRPYGGDIPQSVWLAYIKKVKNRRKVVLCDEMLINDPSGKYGWDYPGIPYQQLMDYIYKGLEAGANGVNVYCGTNQYSWFETMGKISKNING